MDVAPIRTRTIPPGASKADIQRQAEEEIDNRMALLADIERIRAAQQLALEHMEN